MTTPLSNHSINPLLEAALAYAARGWSIFPLKPRTKVLVTPSGFKNATKGPDLIRRWWMVCPDANVGIATGQGSSLAVLDIDPRHGGGESLAELETRYGKFPSTPQVLMGGGGTHHYFALPPGIQARCGELAPGVDMKADGAILEGARNTVLHSLAWDHLAQGLSPDLVLANLHAHNEARCEPPLGDAEVNAIWESACKGFRAKGTEGQHEAAEGETASAATFPEGVWRGLFADYRLLVGPTTEAPDEYHFWLFALLFGVILGRRLYVYHAIKLYPNFYVALVGPTGVSRKDTAWNRAETC